MTRAAAAQGTCRGSGTGADSDKDVIGSDRHTVDGKAGGEQGQQQFGHDDEPQHRRARCPHVFIPAPDDSPAAPRTRKDRFLMSLDTEAALAAAFRALAQPGRPVLLETRPIRAPS